MDEVVEIVARWNDLYGGSAVLLLGEVDQAPFTQQFAVDISKENDDWRRCAAKLAFLYNSEAKRSLEHSPLRIDGNVVEEEVEQLRVELSLVDIMHDVVGDVRHIRLLVGALTRQCIVDIGNRRDLREAVHLLALKAAGIARAIDVLVMLSRDRRQYARFRETVHL